MFNTFSMISSQMFLSLTDNPFQALYQNYDAVTVTISFHMNLKTKNYPSGILKKEIL